MKLINLNIKPYSLWIGYNIINKNAIQDMLPPGMKLANIKILDDTQCTSPKLLFNCYNIDSFWLRGTRLEIMTIAKSNDNYHFVVLDCVTNSIQWDPINRIRGPNGNLKFSYINDILNCNVLKNYKKNKELNFAGSPLDLIKMTRDFAVKSNYDCFYRNSSIPISLKFDEREIMKPVRKLKILNISNNIWNKYREELPNIAFMHENNMRFTTKMPFF
tara:strand:+ start:4544 stop:5194 length:651 start_codon:yes stop_codon:yes gene_type:complete